MHNCISNSLIKQGEKMTNRKIGLSVQLDQTILQQLEQKAQNEKQSLSATARKIIEKDFVR